MAEPVSLLDQLRRLDKKVSQLEKLSSYTVAEMLAEEVSAILDALPEIIEAFELLDGLFGMLPATAIVALHDHSAPVLESEHCVMCIWQRRHDDLLSKVSQ